jgi:hypothetical protein
MGKRVVKKRRAIVPRMGPPTNLRPAGIHQSEWHKTRAESKKAALKDESAAFLEWLSD